MRFGFDAELWPSAADAAWVFVTVPEDISDEILDVTPRARGFGSVKVEVNVGESTWQTSLFPDSKRGAYVLPVKKAIRAAAGIEVGDTVHFRLELV